VEACVGRDRGLEKEDTAAECRGYSTLDQVHMSVPLAHCDFLAALLEVEAKERERSAAQLGNDALERTGPVSHALFE
jgi:hypothetical protein